MVGRKNVPTVRLSEAVHNHCFITRCKSPLKTQSCFYTAVYLCVKPGIQVCLFVTVSRRILFNFEHQINSFKSLHWAKLTSLHNYPRFILENKSITFPKMKNYIQYIIMLLNNRGETPKKTILHTNVPQICFEKKTIWFIQLGAKRSHLAHFSL